MEYGNNEMNVNCPEGYISDLKLFGINSYDLKKNSNQPNINYCGPSNKYPEVNMCSSLIDKDRL